MNTSLLQTPTFLLASSLDPVEEVLVVRNSLTAAFVAQLAEIVPQSGARLHSIDFDEVPNDLWIQDAVEIGRLCICTEHGVDQSLAVLTGLRAKCRSDDIPFAAELLDRRVREHFRSLGASVIPSLPARRH